MPIKRFKVVSKVIIVIILIALICYFFFWLRRASAPQIFGKALLKVNTTQKVIALTFDDGPNPEVTEKIIILLKKYNAHATFFVIGENAKKYPEIIRNIFRNGNEIGNHSWNHEHLIYHSPKFILDQITKTDELIRNLGYAGEIHFRAPYGHKLIVLPYILMKTNRNHILWNIELDDWDSPAPEDMLQKFDQAIHPGAIVLLHDGYVENYQSREATKRLVELLLENYHRKRYQFVTISELLKYEENKY